MIGRIRGVPVLLSPSWFVIAVVLALFAYTMLRSVMSLSTAEIIAASVSLPVFLLLSVFAHELAHGLTGHAVGSPPTEYVLTLWGGHTQFRTEMRTPGASALVSVAGPLANVVVALLAWWSGTQAETPVVMWLAYIVALTNGAVAVFNLLPGHPLDGGRLLEALVWRLTGDIERGHLVAGWGGRVVALAVVGYFIGRPLLEGAQPRPLTAVWVLILAGHLWYSAGQALRGVRVRRSVAALDLRELAEPALVVPAHTTVDEIVSRAAPGTRVVVTDGHGRYGLLDPAALASVPTVEHAQTPVFAVTTPMAATALVEEFVGSTAVAQVARGAAAGHRVVLLRGGEDIVGVLEVERVNDVLRRTRR